jgi:hypothetical protein
VIDKVAAANGLCLEVKATTGVKRLMARIGFSRCAEEGEIVLGVVPAC